MAEKAAGERNPGILEISGARILPHKSIQIILKLNFQGLLMRPGWEDGSVNPILKSLVTIKQPYLFREL